ncbi:hypothetical protein ACFWWO_40660, partial [Streptomyces sp. NPDC058677]
FPPPARPGGAAPRAGGGAPGRPPPPHDPDPEVADGPPLTPPDTTVWGSAQRRLGADEIALQWAIWREQIDDATFGSRDAVGSGTADDEPSEDTGGSQEAETDVRTGHGGIRRVLAEARAYVDAPPPLGRVRSSFAPGDARTLRADGPGWSLVARTDDIAFVLLDDEPGEVLPVGRGPELPGLLEALDKMAVRPI